MQERIYYSQPDESDVLLNIRRNPASQVKRTIDTTVSLIGTVLRDDLTDASYIDRKKELVMRWESAGSEAFRLDYDPSVSPHALYEDIVSYLGEYRFEVPEYKYKQRFTRTKSDNMLRLRGEKDDTPMLVFGENAIKDKIENGENVGKVQADLRGMQRVEELLKNAKTGDRILYASPPDKEYGYDYGFFYDGRVEELEGGEKILHLRALRIDETSDLEVFNTAMTQMTGAPSDHTSPNQFIENPVHITDLVSDAEINKILHSVFRFESNDKSIIKFHSQIEWMQPYIDGFIELIKNNAPLAQIQQAFHALENLALDLKEESSQETVVYQEGNLTQSFTDFVDVFGFKPPDVQGTCGSSGGRSSNNIFGSGSIFSGAVRGGSSQEWFTCPECSYKANGPVGNKCPGCGLTKESYAAKSGVMCD